MDSQTSADTFNESGIAVGAMSYVRAFHPHLLMMELANLRIGIHEISQGASSSDISAAVTLHQVCAIVRVL